jgi:hypothetical protein
MIRYFRQWFAIRRLNRLVEQRRNSHEIWQYRKRRAAALKGLAR